ncbi:MAG: DUF4332 domain-containing protein [bacterium]
MASGKRILGTVSFVVLFLVTMFFLFLLWAKSTDQADFPWVKDAPTVALWVGVVLAALVCLILLAILIRSSDERRNRRAEAEEAARLAAENAARDAFEATLGEPDGLGKGPEMVVYNLGALPQMYHAYGKYERRNKLYPFVTPRTVESALYTNTYIPIDNQGNQLKLRILLAGPPNGQAAELPLRNSQKPVVVMDEKRLASIPEDVRARLPADVREKYWPTGAATEAEPTEEAVPRTGRKADGRGFISELEERLAKRAGTNGSASRAYYDYTGDIHNVEDIEGIGRIYGAKLAQAGVLTTARLAYEEPESLGKRVGVPKKTVEQWQHMGELMKISGVGKQYAEALARAGIQGIAELKRRSPDAIANQVNNYLDTLETNVLGTKITSKRVEGWQKAAAKMRKVRLDVPAE